MTTTTADHAPASQPSVTSASRRLLPHGGHALSIDQHIAVHGAPAYRGRSRALVAEIREAGLTGRGGAAFPVHRKMAAVLSAGGRAVVVANGAEGEPAAHKDKTLLSFDP